MIKLKTKFIIEQTKTTFYNIVVEGDYTKVDEVISATEGGSISSVSELIAKLGENLEVVEFSNLGEEKVEIESIQRHWC